MSTSPRMSSSDATLAAQIALIAGTVAVAIGLIAYSEPHSNDLFGRAKNALDDATSPPHDTILDRLTSFADSASDSLKPWTTISPTSAATPSATIFEAATSTSFSRAPEGFVGENDDDLKAWMAMAN